MCARLHCVLGTSGFSFCIISSLVVRCSDGHPGFPVPNSPHGLPGCKATLEEEKVFGHTCLIVLMGSVDVKQR